jgi:DNA-binding XRE family transcriptional regulator
MLPAMKLNDYLKLKGMTKTQAAKELEITRKYIHEIMAGKMGPGRKLATRIIEWSQGAIRYEDLWG